MYCNKCGAAVIGKYCSCCGSRVRTELEEFRLAEKRAQRSFVDFCMKYPNDTRYHFDLMHLGSACWEAASARYRMDTVFASLAEVRIHAEKLFIQLLNF